MQNELQLHRSFRALYLGQKVYSDPEIAGITELKDIDLDGFALTNSSYLSLKPLSEISDEDAAEIQKIMRLADNEAGFDCTPYAIKKELSQGIEGIVLFDFYTRFQEVIDYLRSKSYLLPFSSLSPEDILTRGWCKLQTK